MRSTSEMRLLSCLVLVHACTALRSDVKVTVRAQAGRDLVGAFGAVPGALVQMNLTVQPPEAIVHVLVHGLYTRELADTMARLGPEGGAAACALPSLARFELGGANESFVREAVIDRKDIIFTRILYCDDAFPDVTITGNVQILNTALGTAYQHLSADDTGAIALYAHEAAVQGVILLAYISWAAVVAWMRRKAPADALDAEDIPTLWNTGVRPVHVLFSFTMLLRLFELCILYAVYVGFARDGKVVTAPRAAGVFGIITNGFLAVTLWTMATGWGYMRQHLIHKEKAVLALYASVYIVCAALRGVCSNSATIDTPIPGAVSCEAVEIAEYVTRSIMLLGAIFSVNYYLTQIRLTVTYDGRAWTPSTAIQYVHETRLRVFRRVFMVCLVLPPILFVARLASFSWEYSWVNALLSEAVSTAQYGVLCTLFYPTLPGLASGGLPAVRAGLEEARAAGSRAAQGSYGEEEEEADKEE